MTERDHPAPLLTVKDAAAFLSVSPRTVRRLISDGELPSHKIGASRRISASAVSALLEATAERRRPHPARRDELSWDAPAERKAAPG